MPHPIRSAAPLALVALLAAAPAVSPAVSPAIPSAVRHTHLKKSAPAANDTLAAAPRELRLWFSEKPELVASSVKLFDAGGRAVAVAKAHGVAGDATQLVAEVSGAMAPGGYRVDWRTMGEDGHPIRGSFRFVVRGR